MLSIVALVVRERRTQMDMATAMRILEQAQAGQTQDDWLVYTVKQSYFIGEAALYIFIGFFLVIVGGVVISVLFIPSTAMSGSDGDSSPIFAVGFAVLLCGAVGIGFLAVAGAKLNSLRSVKWQALVITPQGFVACIGLRDWQTFVIAYERLESIAMTVAHSKYASAITLRMVVKPADANTAGYVTSWRVDPRFGADAAIAQALIAGQARYAATHAAVAMPANDHL